MNLGAAKRLRKDEADSTHSHHYYLKRTFLQGIPLSLHLAGQGKEQAKGDCAHRGSVPTIKQEPPAKTYSQSSLTWGQQPSASKGFPVKHGNELKRSSEFAVAARQKNPEPTPPAVGPGHGDTGGGRKCPDSTLAATGRWQDANPL